MKSTQLKQQRATKYTALAELRKATATEAPTDEQKKEMRDLLDAIDKLTSDLELELRLEKAAAEAATRQAQADGLAARTEENPDGDGIDRRGGVGPRGEEKERLKLRDSFSFTDAINAQLRSGTNVVLDGATKEMHDEAVKEMRAAHVNNVEFKGVGIARSIMAASAAEILAAEQRSITVTGTAPNIANIIPERFGELINVFRPTMMTAALGITMENNMVGTLKKPRQISYTEGLWEGETTTLTETQPEFDYAEWTPNRLGHYTGVSLQSLRTQNVVNENLIRRELIGGNNLAKDRAVINGTGVGMPTGILSVILASNLVDLGANGGSITHDDLVDMIASIDQLDALSGLTQAWLTTPLVKAMLQKERLDSGSGLFTWPRGANELNGYRAATSTVVPGNLEKGTETDLHAMIFGAWSEYLFTTWGGGDLVVDPYTKKLDGMIEVALQEFCDGDVERPKAFAAAVDIKVS